MESIELKATFPVAPAVIYEAWLSSEGHAKMTGGDASCSNQVGDPFSTWNGYIQGTNLELTPNQEIIQSWRTTEFDSADKDSRLVIKLQATGDGTDLTLIHTDIPEGQTQYEQGWIDHYFTPMREYFR